MSAAAAEFSGLVFTAAIADGGAHAPRGIVLTEAKAKKDRFLIAPQGDKRSGKESSVTGMSRSTLKDLL